MATASSFNRPPFGIAGRSCHHAPSPPPRPDAATTWPHLQRAVIGLRGSRSLPGLLWESSRIIHAVPTISDIRVWPLFAGFTIGRMKRCNLACANERRDSRLFAEVAGVLMRRARRLYADQPSELTSPGSHRQARDGSAQQHASDSASYLDLRT